MNGEVILPQSIRQNNFGAEMEYRPGAVRENSPGYRKSETSLRILRCS